MIYQNLNFRKGTQLLRTIQKVIMASISHFIGIEPKKGLFKGMKIDTSDFGDNKYEHTFVFPVKEKSYRFHLLIMERCFRLQFSGFTFGGLKEYFESDTQSFTKKLEDIHICPDCSSKLCRGNECQECFQKKHIISLPDLMWKDDDCSICLGTLSGSKSTTNCNHTFHTICWKSYRGMDCPMCRKPVR